MNNKKPKLDISTNKVLFSSTAPLELPKVIKITTEKVNQYPKIYFTEIIQKCYDLTFNIDAKIDTVFYLTIKPKTAHIEPVSILVSLQVDDNTIIKTIEIDDLYELPF